MKLLVARHGSLILVTGAAAIAAAQGQTPAPVHSRTVDIHYSVNDEALPLDSVRLWYTTDRGETWHEYGVDEDRQSPFVFQAPQENLYGFFLVMTNATGPSSVPPTAATEPQTWAFVDETPPVVQLHPLRLRSSGEQRIVQIRWTAIDQHFGPRPVQLAYQQPPDQTWHPVAADAVANTGRYDWTVPERLEGSVAIRVTVTDAGAHRVHSALQVVELSRERAGLAAGVGSFPRSTGEAQPDQASVLVSSRARQRAERLFAEAITYRDDGQYREGIARLREAVRLNPEWAEAFAEMADMLYRLEEPDRALSAYRLALRREPTLRAALRGAAMIYRKKNDHASAARALKVILQNDPDDAEVWMNLGDVAIFRGDEVLARECYTRAARIDPDATEVIADARKRLALMATVSRTYRPDGK